jgi:hypothetical protein
VASGVLAAAAGRVRSRERFLGNEVMRRRSRDELVG